MTKQKNKNAEIKKQQDTAFLKEQPKKKGILKKIFMTLLVIVFILVCAGLFLALWTPTTGEKINTDENTKIYNALATQGLTDVIVDVTKESTLIVYALPEKANEVGTLFFVTGTVYTLNPTTPKLEIRAYKGETYTDYIIPSELLDKYDTGKITDEELMKEAMIK